MTDLDKKTPQIKDILLQVALQALLALAYFYMARLALDYSLSGFVCLIWPASGLAVSSCILGGPKYAVGIFLGAFIFYASSGKSPLTVLAISTGNTLEAIVAAVLIRKTLSSKILGLSKYISMLLFGSLAAAVSASFGNLALLAAGIIGKQSLLASSASWWMGDMIGIIVICPIVLAWKGASAVFKEGNLPRFAEAAGWLVLVMTIAFCAFIAEPGFLPKIISSEAWLFLAIAFCSIRIGMRGTSIAISVIAVIGLIGVYNGTAFSRSQDQVARLESAWALIAAISFVGMAISSFVAEKRISALKLRESEERFRRIFENAPISFYIHESDSGNIIMANRKALESFGLSSVDDFYTVPPLFLPSPYSFKEYMQAIHKCAQEGDHRLLWKNKSSSGALFWEEVFLNSITLKGKKMVLQTSIDISAIKKGEEEKLELQRQLLQSQKMESLGTLAGGVAHDFNNMLSVINGYSELLISKLDDNSPLRSHANEIRKAGIRSANLSRQLLTFARKQSSSPKVLAPGEALASMIKLLKRLVGEDVALKWTPSQDAPNVKIDPSHLDQILTNLVVNARDAIRCKNSSGKGAISIESSLFLAEADSPAPGGLTAGRYLRICVSDNGSGMEPDVVERIFEPFFTTKGEADGTGLGLSTVFGIVRQNNGFIGVESTLGEGSSFSVYLPAYEGGQDEENEKKTENNSRRLTGTILLVEDNKLILKMLKTHLDELGHRTLPAASPEEALRISDEFQGDIDLMLSDLIMPGMNGKELKQKFSEKRPSTKIIFMSGYSSDLLTKKLDVEDGILFMQKPFSIEELSASIERALG